MKSASDALMTPIRPSHEDVDLARVSAPKINRLKGGQGAVTVTVSQGRGGEELTIPAIAVDLLGMILDELAQGHAVALAPVEREVSTQTAADVLNVSRPHLVKLLESGVMPFTRVGTHRRVRLADVLDYKARMDAAADEAYAQLVQQAQELGMGYE
jgi:excisionase family DNA binding protein